MKRHCHSRIVCGLVVLGLITILLILSPGTAALPPIIDEVVVIENFKFHPATLTSRPGTRVIWINRDQAPHRIAIGNLVSPILNQGEKWSKVFAEKGKHPYHCWIHPGMTGVIVIE